MKTEKVILLVEDNPDDEELTLRALKKGKVQNQVVIARDGEEALSYLKNMTSLPQVVLLDLKLPKVDGIEVLKFIRSNEKTKILPVVMLTSSKEERDVLASYGNGANSYICKPVDITKFTEAIQSLEVYWLLLNETVN